MNRKRWRVLLAVTALICSAALSSAAADLYNKEQVPVKEAPLPAAGDIKALSVFPTNVKLKGLDDAQQIVLTAVLNDGRLQDLTQDAKYEVADEKLVRVTTSGRVIPIANGATEISARFGDKAIKLPVKTEACDVNLDINFGNQIVPIFTKLG